GPHAPRGDLFAYAIARAWQHVQATRFGSSRHVVLAPHGHGRSPVVSSPAPVSSTPYRQRERRCDREPRCAPRWSRLPLPARARAAPMDPQGVVTWIPAPVEETQGAACHAQKNARRVPLLFAHAYPCAACCSLAPCSAHDRRGARVFGYRLW